MARGDWTVAYATARTRIVSNGSITAVAIPTDTALRTPAYSITAGLDNSGTIYLSATGGTGISTVNNQTRTALTAGQTFSFTGLPIGYAGPRTFIVGTGYTYIHASATSQTAIMTYYKLGE